tara:strand:- start:229 stop:804 length:576 start_codon:yes stop_codon:yes gene_type:complete
MSDKPTFEELIGNSEPNKWDSDVTNDELANVSSLAQKQINLSNEVSQIEDMLKAKKEELRLVQEQELPDALSEVGLTQIVLSSGEKISLSEFYSAHISKANQQQAYQWLIENGHEGIIKNEVSLKFNRGESQIVDETVLALKSRGLSPEVKQSIHPSTLKAFVKEQLTTGNDIPTEPFGIYIGTKANIKKE